MNISKVKIAIAIFIILLTVLCVYELSENNRLKDKVEFYKDKISSENNLIIPYNSPFTVKYEVYLGDIFYHWDIVKQESESIYVLHLSNGLKVVVSKEDWNKYYTERSSLYPITFRVGRKDF